MAAEIVMTDGTTKFMTLATATAESVVQNFERRTFAKIPVEDGQTIYINPVNVAYIRDA